MLKNPWHDKIFKRGHQFRVAADTMDYKKMQKTTKLGKTNNETYRNHGQACDCIFHSAIHPTKFTRSIVMYTKKSEGPITF